MQYNFIYLTTLYIKEILMGILDIILIAIALSMDACVLTIANNSLYGKSLSPKKRWLMPIMFGLFQGIMPLIGYFLGSTFASFLQNYSGFLTASVFYALAIKIVIDIVKDKSKEKDKNSTKKVKNFTFVLVLIQAFATSIDALLIGVTFSLGIKVSVFVAVSIIAVITFLLVMMIGFLGRKLGEMLGKYADWIGCALLFSLATKELIEAISKVI